MLDLQQALQKVGHENAHNSCWLQIESMKSACVNYLLELDLSPQQLGYQSVQYSCWLQVESVEAACVDYLLELNLSPQQLGQLVVLFGTLSLTDAVKKLLRLHANQTWTNSVMDTLAVLFQQLVFDANNWSICTEVLRSPSCGAVCELQVA